MRGSARAPCPGSARTPCPQTQQRWRHARSRGRPRSFVPFVRAPPPCPHTHQITKNGIMLGVAVEEGPFSRTSVSHHAANFPHLAEDAGAAKGSQRTGGKESWVSKESCRSNTFCVDRHCTCFPVHAMAKTELPLQDSPRFWMLQI